MQHQYFTDIVVDDQSCIVTVYCRNVRTHRVKCWQTAWGTEDRPDDIATYDDREQAIGEVMTSLRDGFDKV